MRVSSTIILTGLLAVLNWYSACGSVDVPPVEDDVKAATTRNDGCSAEGVDNANGSGQCPSKGDEIAGDEANDVASSEEEEKSPTSLTDFMRIFKRLGTSWTHVFGEYLDTVRSAHGKALKGDVYADDMGAALDRLRELVTQARNDASGAEEERLGRMWDFRSIPLGEFDRTLDDVLVAFLRWSAADSVDEDDECDLRGGTNKKGVTPINVSNAFRRLEAYAKWMEQEADDLLSPPLTSKSVREARDLLYSRVSEDSCGRVVWWLDLSQTDFASIKHLPQKDILRLFVWLAHLVMFNEKAQENGIIFVDSMGRVSFLQYMTMLPLQLGMAIDKFMICVIPLKTKLVVFMKRPLWFDVAFGILSIFLKARMKKRVELPEGDQVSVEGIIGQSDRIPVGFDDIAGSLTADLIALHDKRETMK